MLVPDATTLVARQAVESGPSSALSKRARHCGMHKGMPNGFAFLKTAVAPLSPPPQNPYCMDVVNSTARSLGWPSLQCWLGLPQSIHVKQGVIHSTAMFSSTRCCGQQNCQYGLLRRFPSSRAKRKETQGPMRNSRDRRGWDT